MIKNCPICQKSTNAQLGKSCKFCDMALEDSSREFCSKTCRIKYKNLIKK